MTSSFCDSIEKLTENCYASFRRLTYTLLKKTVGLLENFTLAFIGIQSIFQIKIHKAQKQKSILFRKLFFDLHFCLKANHFA